MVIGADGVRRLRLANGLRVLLAPRRGMGTVSLALGYEVGTRVEPPGMSGVAHLIEHLQFKGSARYGRGEIDRLTQEMAGRNNAVTGLDDTIYTFTFASSGWREALRIEADRMRNARWETEDFELERQVVLEEAAMYRDVPQEYLMDRLWAWAFRRHPYGNPIIGSLEDLSRITAAQVREFYRRWYAPDHAVLALVGQFSLSEAEEEVSRAFAGVAGGGEPLPDPAPEPAQARERRVTVRRPSEMGYLYLGYRGPSPRSREHVALLLLPVLLASDKRSPLVARLIEAEGLASDVSVIYGPTRDPHLFVIAIELQQGVAAEEALRAVDEELDRLRRVPPGLEDLEGVKRQLGLTQALSLESGEGLAAALAEAELRGGYEELFATMERIESLRPEDVQAACRRVLVRRRRTVARLIPVRGEPPGSAPVAERSVPAGREEGARTSGRMAGGGSGGATATAPERPLQELRYCDPPRLELETRDLANGTRLLLVHRPGTRAAIVRLLLRGGSYLEDDQRAGLANLTFRCLREGTRERSAEEIDRHLRRMGALLHTGGRRAAGILGLEVLDRHLVEGLELLAELVREPRFEPGEVEQERSLVLAELAARSQEAAVLAVERFRALVYGDHPNHRRVEGSPETLERLGADELREFHRRWIVPGAAILLVVGDFERAPAEVAVERVFGDWSGGAWREPQLPEPPPPGAPLRERIPLPREQSVLVLGHLGVARRHEDFDALLLFDNVFGMSTGLNDRLQSRLREEAGLVYDVQASITASAGLAPGAFQVHLATHPEKLERAAEAVVGELRRVLEEGVTEREAALARRAVIAALLEGFDTGPEVARQVLEREFYGLPLLDHREVAGRLEALDAAAITAAARRHIRVESLIMVGAGP
jgi:zinc protease